MVNSTSSHHGVMWMVGELCFRKESNRYENPYLTLIRQSNPTFQILSLSWKLMIVNNFRFSESTRKSEKRTESNEVLYLRVRGRLEDNRFLHYLASNSSCSRPECRSSFHNDGIGF